MATSWCCASSHILYLSLNNRNIRFFYLTPLRAEGERQIFNYIVIFLPATLRGIFTLWCFINSSTHHQVVYHPLLLVQVVYRLLLLAQVACHLLFLENQAMGELP